MPELPASPEPLGTDIHKPDTAPAIPISEALRDSVGITITHHIPDTQYSWLPLDTPDGLPKTLKSLKEAGVTTQRFDMRWGKISPSQDGAIQEDYVKRACTIANVGSEHGLENVIVLSTAPTWALELAKTNPQRFKEAYESYIESVFSALIRNNVQAPEKFQIFNELNMKNYTPPELLPQLSMCVDVVNSASEKFFNRHIPLVATLQVSSPLGLKSIPGAMEGAVGFVDSHKDLLKTFDQIDLDYYPGVWHTPKQTLVKYIKNARYLFDTFRYRNNPVKQRELKTPLDIFRTFKEMELLDKTLAKLQSYGIKSGIGEIGTPSVAPYKTTTTKEEHEKLQTIGMSLVMDRLKPMVGKYGLKNIGIYSLVDEPKPEVGVFDWGMYDKDGKPKHAATRLGKIIQKINPAPRDRLVALAQGSAETS